MTLPKFQTKYLPNLVEIGWMVSKSITDTETFFVLYYEKKKKNYPMTLPKFQRRYLPNLVEIGWMVSKSITDIETFFVFYIYRYFIYIDYSLSHCPMKNWY